MSCCGYVTFRRHFFFIFCHAVTENCVDEEENRSIDSAKGSSGIGTGRVARKAG